MHISTRQNVVSVVATPATANGQRGQSEAVASSRDQSGAVGSHGEQCVTSQASGIVYIFRRGQLLADAPHSNSTCCRSCSRVSILESVSVFAARRVSISACDDATNESRHRRWCSMAFCTDCTLCERSMSGKVCVW